MRVYREVSKATQYMLELHTSIGRLTAQAMMSSWSSWLDVRCGAVRIVIVGSHATKLSLSWGPAPPSYLDHCCCITVCCHCVAIIVVAPIVTVFIIASLQWLPLCHGACHHHCLWLVVVMGMQGSHWPLWQ